MGRGWPCAAPRRSPRSAMPKDYGPSRNAEQRTGASRVKGGMAVDPHPAVGADDPDLAGAAGRRSRRRTRGTRRRPRPRRRAGARTGRRACGTARPNCGTSAEPARIPRGAMEVRASDAGRPSRNDERADAHDVAVQRRRPGGVTRQRTASASAARSGSPDDTMTRRSASGPTATPRPVRSVVTVRANAVDGPSWASVDAQRRPRRWPVSTTTPAAMSGASASATSTSRSGISRRALRRRASRSRVPSRDSRSGYKPGRSRMTTPGFVPTCRCVASRRRSAAPGRTEGLTGPL